MNAIIFASQIIEVESMKNIIKLLVLSLLFGCQLECSVITKKTDLGQLPDQVIDYLPYTNGQNVKYVHSGDSVISMKVSRENEKQYEYYEDECSSITYIYSADVTRMASPDSTFRVTAWITNLATTDWYDVLVGTSTFKVPVSAEYRAKAEMFDSYTINGIEYDDVFRLPRDSVLMAENAAVLVDTLFFNVDYGFLEFVLEDGQRYKRQE